MALGLGGLVQKATSFRSIIRKGLQAWYKSDTTQAPLGEEEIANGNFFVGSELVVNDGFGDGGNTWSSHGSGVSFSNGEAVIPINNDNDNVGIYQENVFTNAKTYKITIKAKGSDSFTANLLETQGASSEASISNISLTTNYQEFIIYHTASGTNDIFIQRLFGHDAGKNQTIFVDNISIRQVNPNDIWLIANGGANNSEVTIKDGSVLIDYDSTDNQNTGISIGGIITLNKKYKVEIVVDSLSVDKKLKVHTGNDSNTLSVGINTFEMTSTSANTFSIARTENETSVTAVVSKVSLKEITNSVKDFSLNINNGVLYSGTCLDFDGTDDSIDLDYWKSEAISASTKATFTCWINADDATNQKMFLAAETGTNNRFYIGTQAEKLDLGWGSSSWATTTNLSGTVPTILDAKWYRVVIVVDGLTCKIYLDGEYQYEKTNASGFTLDSSGLYLAIHGDQGNYDWPGKLADFQIYDSAWSASDVTYDYNNPDKDVFDNSNTSILSGNCKALYRLNEGAGTRVYNAAPVLGEELVVDGSWALHSSPGDWSIDNVNNIFTSSGGTGSIRNTDGSSSVSVGKYYKATFEILERTAGGVKLFSGDGQDQASHKSTVGVHTYVFESLSNSIYLHSAGFNGSVGNVSFKEVTLSNSLIHIGNPTWATAQPYIPQYAMSSYSKKAIFGGAGSGDYINCGSDSSIDDLFDGGGTWSAWVSGVSDGGGSTGTILSKGQPRFRVIEDGGDDLTLQFIYTAVGDNGVWVCPSTALLENKLNHIAVSFNSDGDPITADPVIYINGVSQTVTESTTPGGARDTDAGSNFIIGNVDTSTDHYFDGFIDEVAIFDKILTEAEVQEIFNAGTALDVRDHSAYSDLTGYWRNSGTDTWDDLSTNSNNGTVNGSPTTIQLQEVPQFNKDSLGLPMNRVRQKGLNLDGDSYVKVDDDSSLGAMDDGFTCAFWYRHFEDIDTSNYSYLVAKGTGLGKNVDHGFAVSVYDNKIYADLNTNTTPNGRFTINYSIGAASSSSPVWYYITATYNGSDELELYVDATSRGTAAVTGSVTATAEAYPITIGTDKNYYSEEARAVVDEVKWYNRDLSQTEITKNWKASKGKHSSTSSWSDDFGDGFV